VVIEKKPIVNPNQNSIVGVVDLKPMPTITAL
jgi:hypothetical protein